MQILVIINEGVRDGSGKLILREIKAGETCQILKVRGERPFVEFVGAEIQVQKLGESDA